MNLLPCTRGCIRAGTEGEILPATHGRYCSRCWGRIHQALLQAPELAGHIVGNIQSTSAAGERVDSSKAAPLPFNDAAFTDVNELYSMLVYWCRIWADYLEVLAPAPAARAWRRDSGTVAGLPADFDYAKATAEVRRMTRWLLDRLDQILDLAPEDVDEFDAAIRDVWRMNARWPRIERPRFAAAPCPTCNRRVAVYPPTFPGDVRRIVCEGDHAFAEEEFERISRDHATEIAEREKGAKVAARLARKYLCSKA